MAALALPLMVTGSVLSAAGTLQQGRAAAAQGRAQQRINDIAAKQTIASAQRGALEEKRRAELLASRALAVAAAGGGASDPSVIRTIADIEGEGAYRAGVELYRGEEEAKRLRTEGTFARMEGEQTQKSSRVRAATSLLGAGAGLYGKYGSKTGASYG